MDHDSFFKDYDPLSSESNDDSSFTEILHKQCNLDLNISIIEEENNRLPIAFQSVINENNKLEVKRRKRNKADLNKTPLPIFDCIYCSNEIISFGHLSSLLISYHYLLCSSIENKAIIQHIIASPIIIDYSSPDIMKRKDNQLLKNMIVSHTEYITKCYSNQDVRLYFTSDQFAKVVASKEKEKYEERMRKKIVRVLKEVKHCHSKNNNIINNKGKVRIDYNKQTQLNRRDLNNNDFSFNSNSLSLNYKNKNTYEHIPSSKLKIQNNKKSYQMKEDSFDNYNNNDDHNNYKDINEDFFKFLKFEAKRKINHDDIEWESSYFSIWDPVFDEDNNYNNKENDTGSNSKNIDISSDQNLIQLYQSNKIIFRPKSKSKQDNLVKSKNKMLFIPDIINHSHSQSNNNSHNHSNQNNNNSQLPQKEYITSDSPTIKSCSSIQSKLQEFLNDYNLNQYNTKSSKMLSTQCESKLSVNSPISITNGHINYNNIPFKQLALTNFNSQIMINSSITDHIKPLSHNYQKINSHCNSIIPSEKYINESNVDRTDFHYDKNNKSHNNSRNIETAFTKKKKDIIELIYQEISTRKNSCGLPFSSNIPKRLNKLTRSRVNVKSILFTSNKLGKN